MTREESDSQTPAQIHFSQGRIANTAFTSLGSASPAYIYPIEAPWGRVVSDSGGETDDDFERLGPPLITCSAEPIVAMPATSDGSATPISLSQGSTAPTVLSQGSATPIVLSQGSVTPRVLSQRSSSGSRNELRPDCSSMLRGGVPIETPLTKKQTRKHMTTSAEQVP